MKSQLSTFFVTWMLAGAMTSAVGAQSNLDPGASVARPPRVASEASAAEPPLPTLTAELPPPTAPGAGTVLISFDQPQQVVEGFGFSTAWGSLPGEKNLDAFFSVTKGAGFSILRNRIPFRESPSADDNFLAKKNGAYVFTRERDRMGEYKRFRLQWENWDLAATRKLIARVQAHPDYQLEKIFSSPWTPPNNAVDRWKLPTASGSNAKHPLTEASYQTRPEVGGSLEPAHYQDYADLLADYVLEFRARMGAELYALSLQNEPNFDCDYESCDWTGRDFHDFLLVLNRQFARKGVWAKYPSLRIMAPEDNNFDERLLEETYANPIAREVLDIAAGHQYEYGPWSIKGDVSRIFTEQDTYQPAPFAASKAHGKQVWMSEWNLSAFGKISPMQQALVLARVVHQDFVQSNLNAFVFWWSSSLLENGMPTKSLWSLAQYSRYVRPGWRVVAATATPAQGVYVTAFGNPRTRTLALVVVNTTSEPKSVFLRLSGASSFETLNLHRTSAEEDMAAIGFVRASGSGQKVELKEASISTFTATLR